MTFAKSGGGEAIRAFLIFGGLILVLTGIAVQLAFREVSLAVLTNRLLQVQSEAERIAGAVAQIGREGQSINFSRVRDNRAKLINLIHQRLDRSYFMRHVEIRDRFGVRQLFVAQGAFSRRLEVPVELAPVPSDWPGQGEPVIAAPLALGEGDVLVGLAPGPVLEELRRLERSLRLKIGIATALALAVLIAGLFYVLHLIRKNRMLEQSRQSAARTSYVGLLASGLAHEIRNPLNAMNLNLEMLEEEVQASQPEQSDLGELLDSTKSEIKRLESLVNNFLAYARPASPRFKAEDLNQVVDEVARFLEPDFRQNEVELRVDAEPLLPSVELDRTLFKQALMNLLVNARQVLKSGGAVHVRSRAGSAGEVVLEVEDNGPGIPAEAHGRIFEVFYSRRGGGTGLGLPIARQIIERHGGTIEMQSVVGQGTLFRIRIPRRHDRPVEPSPSTA